MKCPICENKGIKCTPKGIVYKAVCQKCINIGGTGDNNEMDETGDVMEKVVCDETIEITRNSCYVGETSRQLCGRAEEHLENARKLKLESFIVEHWCLHHGTDVVAPEFKFQVVSSHRDAMSRQLTEAVLILKQGNLNRKKEYLLNELISLQASKYTWDKEQDDINEALARNECDSKLKNFIDVISNVREMSPIENGSNVPDISSPTNENAGFRYNKKRIQKPDTVRPTPKKNQDEHEYPQFFLD